MSDDPKAHTRLRLVAVAAFLLGFVIGAATVALVIVPGDERAREQIRVLRESNRQLEEKLGIRPVPGEGE